MSDIARIDSALDGVKVAHIVKRIEAIRLSEQRHDGEDFGTEVSDAVQHISGKSYPTAKRLSTYAIKS